jgi:acetamidase/formamidase
MLSGTFQFIVHKDRHLLWPMAETPDSYIIMGFSEDLNKATELALHNMLRVWRTKGTCRATRPNSSLRRWST